MIYTENMLSLFSNRFRIYHSGMWIKRESGVNPGQSRCCEAPKNIPFHRDIRQKDSISSFHYR